MDTESTTTATVDLVVIKAADGAAPITEEGVTDGGRDGSSEGE